MRKMAALLVMLFILLAAQMAVAAEDARFKDIKIFDDILVYVDVDDNAVTPEELKAKAIRSFENHMRGMELNNDAWVDNYPRMGLKLENVGYIMLKLMSIRTKGGVNAYHLTFEFGIPPRQVYWDSADMGIAPTSRELKIESFEDVDGLMERFAEDFYKIRGQ